MKQSILIVDDEPSILDIMSMAFSRAGYDPVTAESAEQAMEIMEESPVNVMLVDLRLPGMNGLEFGRKMRKKHPKASMFAMTGYYSNSDLDECRSAGFEDFFTKPVKLDVLINTAKKAFERLENQDNR
jgi:DNA-binding NtrC family response regulator